MRIRLKYLIEDIDRHGNVRFYVRIPGRPMVRIRERLGTPEFFAAYQRAVSERPSPTPRAKQVAPGSFRHPCILYYQSADFTRLDPSTQAWRRHHLDDVAQRRGEKPVGMMQPRHVRTLRDEYRDKPVVANKRLKALRALFSWAVEDGQASDDPTVGVKLLRHISAGFHSWDNHDVETFENRHPVGTQARLAMTLLFYTGCRREDVVRLGPQHVRDGRIRYRQAKNEHHNPIDIDIPLHPDLVAVLAATPSAHLTFLTTAYGRPFTSSGFGNKFRQWCDDAQLPHRSAHGLRKATAARLAEHGATAHEIMAITGHRSLEEVERYTRAARQRKLADAAMAKFKSGTDAVPPNGRWDNLGKKL